jgi:NTP pyrophosphatase (non-canonical NTP hydrolase)
MSRRFQVGDRVRVIDGRPERPAHGTVHTVSGYSGLGVTLESDPDPGSWYHEWRFELVERPVAASDLPDVMLDVIVERRRQDEKFGPLGNLGGAEWGARLAVLMEEVGEAAKEVNELREPGAVQRLRAELIQVAAVAVCLVQCLDMEE